MRGQTLCLETEAGVPHSGGGASLRLQPPHGDAMFATLPRPSVLWRAGVGEGGVEAAAYDLSLDLSRRPLYLGARPIWTSFQVKGPRRSKVKTVSPWPSAWTASRQRLKPQ